MTVGRSELQVKKTRITHEYSNLIFYLFISKIMTQLLSMTIQFSNNNNNLTANISKENLKKGFKMTRSAT